ncbi:MAG: hypothetical protein ACM3NZ_00485 [Betaproteobacteria bacterium]
MSFPAFFDAAPAITVRDPLARFLGAAVDGMIEYHYVDAVKLAGHSCPTVASAYLMTRTALRTLYSGALPERGAIRVELGAPASEGVTGVIANVASYLAGAAQEGGFKGIGGRFDRRGLLRFGAAIPGEIRFTRADGKASVDVAAQLARVPSDPRMPALLRRCASGEASADDAALFASLWQERVRRLLLEHADDPEVIMVVR